MKRVILTVECFFESSKYFFEILVGSVAGCRFVLVCLAGSSWPLVACSKKDYLAVLSFCLPRVRPMGKNMI